MTLFPWCQRCLSFAKCPRHEKSIILALRLKRVETFSKQILLWNNKSWSRTIDAIFRFYRIANFSLHTEAIWTFTFHKKSGFVRVIWRQISIQPSGQIHHFFGLVYYTFFFYFVAEFVKSPAFYTLLLLFQRVEMFGLRFDAKITIQISKSTLWNSSNSV